MSVTRFLPRNAMQQLIDALATSGYRVLGPQVRDGAILYDDLQEATALPGGWTDDQAPGSYRLSQVDTPRCFAWANGPQALKPELFRAREVLWRVSRDEGGTLRFQQEEVDGRPLAVIGVRACDIAALRLQDRHFLDNISDPYYAAHRRDLFVVAVHCSYPADTCFCVSTGDGPRAESGFDVALGELDDGFLVEVGSERGAQLIEGLALDPAGESRQEQLQAGIDDGARRQFRQLPSRNLRDSLFARLEHPRWETVAVRCLACGNCTSVCPTCFCHAEQETPSLDGMDSAHVREWDSCFSEGHAYLHGFQVRPEIRQRYRQWLVHKLGSWHDQYGRSGCVGCGRCIAWCPVGIDITEEANVICDGAGPGGGDA
ncbi:MAG: 4Fe-4S dicluster domain-containing protein [Gammaproteobacteria bacterium]|nr:4Fe-4S dicluster domain-containing protein [Gammaproteobacteria bacterium]